MPEANIPQQSFIQSLFGNARKRSSGGGFPSPKLQYELPQNVIDRMNQDAKIAELAGFTSIGATRDAASAISLELEKAFFGDKAVKMYGKEDNIVQFTYDTMQTALADSQYDEVKKLAGLERFEDMKKEYSAYVENAQKGQNEARANRGQAPIQGYGVYSETSAEKVDTPSLLNTRKRVKQVAQVELHSELQGLFHEPSGKYGIPLASQISAQRNLINLDRDNGGLFKSAVERSAKELENQKDDLQTKLGIATGPARTSLQTALVEVDRKLALLKGALDTTNKDSAINKLAEKVADDKTQLFPWLREKYLRAQIWRNYVDHPIRSIWERQILGRKKPWEQGIKTFDLENKLYEKIPGGKILRRVDFFRNPRRGAFRLLFRGIGSLIRKGFFGTAVKAVIPWLFGLLSTGLAWGWGVVSAGALFIASKAGALFGALSTVLSATTGALAAVFAGVTAGTLAIAGAVVATGIILGLAVYFLGVNPLLNYLEKNTGNFHPPYVTTIRSQALQSIFVNAAKQACVPPELMLSIAQREAGGSFNYTDEQVAKFSNPGWWLTASSAELQTGYCYNTCDNPSVGCAGKDVQGVMQFELGTFNGYVSQLQQILGHEPNRCNVQDVIYAAALKIKANSSTGSSTCSGWSDQTVRQVAGAYCGGQCVDSAACGVGYCEDVLRTYKNYLGFYGGGGNTVLLASLANLLQQGYSDDFGFCARFIDTVMSNAGYTPIAQPTAVQYFAAAKPLGYKTYEAGFEPPLPGDIVVWKNENTRDGQPGHIDIVWRVDDQTVELRGNDNERFVAQRLGNVFQAPPAAGGDNLVIVGLIRLPVK